MRLIQLTRKIDGHEVPTSYFVDDNGFIIDRDGINISLPYRKRQDVLSLIRRREQEEKAHARNWRNARRAAVLGTGVALGVAYVLNPAIGLGLTAILLPVAAQQSRNITKDHLQPAANKARILELAAWVNSDEGLESALRRDQSVS